MPRQDEGAQQAAASYHIELTATNVASVCERLCGRPVLKLSGAAYALRAEDLDDLVHGAIRKLVPNGVGGDQ